MEKHSILINGDLYEDISSYCKTNGLKINAFCEKMLKQLFMTEKYGDIPFGQVKEENLTIRKIAEKETEILSEFANKMNKGKDDAESLMSDIIEMCGGSDEYDKVINECLFSKEGTEELEKDADSNNAIENVEEIMPKPRKRRLK